MRLLEMLLALKAREDYLEMVSHSQGASKSIHA